MTTSWQKAIGSAAERAVAKQVGGIRVGHDGGPVDVIMPGYAQLQVKNLKTIPPHAAIEQMARLMPEGTLRAVVIIARAGRGKRGLRTITFLLDEWVTWHGDGDSRVETDAHTDPAT